MLAKRFFLKDPYLKNDAGYQSGLVLIEDYSTQTYREAILKASKRLLNVDMGAVLIQKNDKGVEFFGFFGNKKTSALQSLYLNHAPLLSSFATHFKNELRSVLTQMEQEASSLIDLKGPDFIDDSSLYDQTICPAITSTQLQAYYRDLDRTSQVLATEKLSLREKQCLKLLLEDLSAKESATVLGLSRRTIEYYFENIKNKLVCWSKQEVLQVAKNLDKMVLL